MQPEHVQKLIELFEQLFTAIKQARTENMIGVIFIQQFPKWAALYKDIQRGK